MEINKWIKNSRSKKILVCKNPKNGLRLIRGANKAGVARLNVSVKNFLQLASELIIADWARQDKNVQLKYLDNTVCSVIVDELLRENADKLEALIPEECICLAAADEVLGIINQIRLNRASDEFENSKDKKVEQLKYFIDLYEKRLESEGKYDYCLLLKRAVEAQGSKEYFADCRFGVVDFLELTSLEQTFINHITDGNGYDEIEYYTNDDKKNKVRFYKAYGISNEVEYIIRDIMEKKTNLGDVNVFYSNDVYVSYIRSIFESYNISYSIVSPYAATALNIVGFMLAVIDWAQSGYKISGLESVAVNTKFNVRGALSQLNRVVDYGIGWGIDSYDLYIKDLEKKREKQKSTDEPQNELKNEPKNELKNKLTFNDFLTELVPIFRNYSNISALYEGLFEITKRFTKAQNIEKRLVMEKLKGLKNAFDEVKISLSLNDALEIIKHKLENLRVSDAEKTNGISVAKQGEIAVIERRYNYFIGFANELFSVTEIESPVLSDSELARYVRGNVRLAKNQNNEKKKSIRYTMNTVSNAEFIFGCSIYDAVEQNYYSTSYFYRSLVEDYLDDDVPDKFDRIEVCGYRDIVDKSIKINSDTVLTGLEDDEEYTSVLPESLSATSVKTMLECPLKFYYACVEHVPELNYSDDSGVDSIVGKQRGTLCHSLLEKYANENLKKPKEEISKQINTESYNKIFDECFEEIKNHIPCVSPKRLEDEKEALRQSLSKYVQALHDEFTDTSNGVNWKVAECEYDFKNFKYMLQYADKSAEIAFTGKIDRVDSYEGEDGKEHFRVIDYKTGKSIIFSMRGKGKKKKKNQNIQHILYPLVMAQTGGIVDESSYVALDVNKTDGGVESFTFSGAEILDFDENTKKALTDVIIDKRFEKRDETDCEFCNYANICRERTEEK